MSARGALSTAILAGCAAMACAPVDARPPRDLVAASSALARAEASPFAEEAAAAIADAEAALEEAEREAVEHPRRAADSAYVARRMAERARFAAQYEAEREALEKARAAALRLGAELERREAEARAIAAREKALAEASAARQKARRAALEGARGEVGVVLERGEGFVFRLPAEALFLPGTSLLRDGAVPRLAALAAALRNGAPCDVRIDVVEDVEGFRTRADLLASRRRTRVHDLLRAYGIPAAAFARPLRHPPCGTQVDVVVIERPISVAPESW